MNINRNVFVSVFTITAAILMAKLNVNSFVIFLAVYFVSSIANILIANVRAVDAFIGALFFGVICAVIAHFLKMAGEIPNVYLVLSVIGFAAMKHMFHKSCTENNQF